MNNTSNGSQETISSTPNHDNLRPLLQQSQQTNENQYNAQEEEYRAIVQRVMEISQEAHISHWYSQTNELKMKYRKMIPNLKMKSTSQKCTICMDQFVLDDIIKKLPCKHIMHRQCAKDWLKVNKTCPVCRMDLQKHYKGICELEKNDQQKCKQQKMVVIEKIKEL